jgi:hypothetical protein
VLVMTWKKVLITIGPVLAALTGPRATMARITWHSMDRRSAAGTSRVEHLRARQQQQQQQQ